MFARRAVKSRVRRDQRGVALVEFALMLPFIAMIVFGTVDLSRGFTQQNRLKNASREGAALARLRPNGLNCGISANTEREDGALTGLPNASVTVIRENGLPLVNTCDSLPVGDTRKVPAGETVIVRVRADFRLVTPFVGIVTGDPIHQKAETKVVVQE